MDDKRRERILMMILALVVVSIATLTAVYLFVSEIVAIVVGAFLLAVVVILIIESNERNQVRDLLGMLITYEAAKNKVDYVRQQQHLQILKDKQRLNREPEQYQIVDQEPSKQSDPRLLKEPEWTEGWTLEEEEGFKIVEAATERR